MNLFKIASFAYLLTILFPISAGPVYFNPAFTFDKSYSIDAADRTYKKGMSCVLGELKNVKGVDLFIKPNGVTFYNTREKKEYECSIESAVDVSDTKKQIIANIIVSKFLVPLRKQDLKIEVTELANTAKTSTCSFIAKPYWTWQTYSLAGLGVIACYLWNQKNN